MIVLRTCHVPTPAERRAWWRVRYEQLTVEQQLGLESPRPVTQPLGRQAEAGRDADAERPVALRAGGVAVPRMSPAQVRPAQPAPTHYRARIGAPDEE